ncbi:hypothetical protein ACFLV5_05740 [Chloroflexota bacterium]
MKAGRGEEASAKQPQARCFIDLDWYQRNNRSFSSLAQNHICPKCTEKFSAVEKEISAEKLLSAIGDCCSHTPGFITEKTPILKSLFLLFLANGNQPLDLEELGSQLSEWRGGDAYRTSPEILPRLLNNDDYYGLRMVED